MELLALKAFKRKQADAQARYRARNPGKTKALKKAYLASTEGKATTAAYNARYNKGTLLMVGLAKARPCADCNGSYPYEVMEFDHLDPETKVGDVAVMARKQKASVVFAEIAKCELVCANCHRIRTLTRRLDKGLSGI